MGRAHQAAAGARVPRGLDLLTDGHRVLPTFNWPTPGAAAPINTPHILTVTRAGEAAGQTKVYVDGASLGNDAAVPAFPTGIAYLGVANGNTAYWQGYIAAVLVYHAVLSDDERANVHNYLAAKYGVTLTG